MKPDHKILFITEKYTDGDPNALLTNNFHNLFGSLDSSGLDIPYNNLFLDELFVQRRVHINQVLEHTALSYSPTIAIFSLLGDSPMNPSNEAVAQIKNLGIKTIFLWPDTGFSWAVNRINNLGHLADLHVSWGGDEVQHAFLHKHLWMWAPQDERLYYPAEVQDIDASFLGSLRYGERQQYARHIQQNATNILIHGGQRENKLPPEQYAELMRRSKISINFSGSPCGIPQIKGRVMEVLASRSMLLEQENPATKKHLIPGKHYVSFNSPEDLLEKVEYYLKHEEERVMISENGYQKYLDTFASEHFWTEIIERVEKDG